MWMFKGGVNFDFILVLFKFKGGLKKFYYVNFIYV